MGFDSDISEDSPKKGDIELLKTPLLCGVEQMVERLTNINNILEAEDDGLKYLKLNNFYNFRQAETHATTLEATIPEMG